MNQVDYAQLVTKTFRDDAIRSVMLIDDDFIPYAELCRPGFELDNAPASKRDGTVKAAGIHQFFQQKRIICDIDSATDHVNVEKIRKCDLIILDYHLEQDDPRKSLSLLNELSSTDHMNVVVVYTREDLNKVWISAAATLRGNALPEMAFGEDADALGFWNVKTEYGANIPEDWTENISTEDLVAYVTTGTVTTNTRKWFGINIKSHVTNVIRAACEYSLGKQNILGTPINSQPVLGNIGKSKWIQFGNLFVILHQKAIESAVDEPEHLWQAVQDALADWNPTYYQLLISEIQNRLENESISFRDSFSHDNVGQAAWLHHLLGKESAQERSNASTQLMDRLTEEIRVKLSNDAKLQERFTSIFDFLGNQFATEKNSLLNYAAKQSKVGATATLAEDLGHAINYALCTTEFVGAHITSGTVLVNKDTEQWYLCVAPACETVPLQTTGALAKRLQPHRLMKVMILNRVALNAALPRAEESNHIFVKDHKGNRIALEALNPVTKQPAIDYLLINNHDESNKEILTKGIQAALLGLDKESNIQLSKATLHPVSQLRDIYTARFQAIASHHSGRVGVDFVNSIEPK